jgi:hypothetical protein
LRMGESFFGVGGTIEAGANAVHARFRSGQARVCGRGREISSST